ncbi:hypothetical protein B7463_g5470, partial [Scytalidium lignicola]
MTSDVTASFTYVKDLPLYNTEKPYIILTHLNENHSRSNLEWETAAPEVIRNIRGQEGSFKLDDYGFAYCQAPTQFSDWDSNEKVEAEYLPEVMRILKENVEGVDHVEIFDWRRRAPGKGQEFTNLNNPTEPLAPAEQVHLDQSPQGVLKRVKLLMGEKSSEYLQGRIRVINVWRPLFTVQDRPLAVCDGRTMKYSDLLETDLVRINYVGSTMFAKYRTGYEWYYLDQQTKNEFARMFHSFKGR